MATAKKTDHTTDVDDITNSEVGKAPASSTPATPGGTPGEDQPQLSYEQARDELISVVNRLESGGESLADSLELFKRGEALAGLCEQYLDSARATVEGARED